MNLSEKHLLPEIPVRCLKCPGLLAALERVRLSDIRIEQFKALAAIAMEGTPDIMQDLISDAIGLSSDIVGEEIAGFEAHLRHNIAETMDQNDEAIDKERYDMTQRLSDCSGVLKLRVQKEGFEYIVGICGSRAQTSGDNLDAASIHLRPLE